MYSGVYIFYLASIIDLMLFILYSLRSEVWGLGLGFRVYLTRAQRRPRFGVHGFNGREWYVEGVKHTL